MKKFTYTKGGDVYRTLIHYQGDSSLASRSKPHVRTCPSILRKLEKDDRSPAVVYKRNVSKANESSLEYHTVCLPRNVKQVANMQSIHRQKVRLSHDGLYNLHELSYNIDNYVQKIVTFPDLVVVCGLSYMLKELNKLLHIQSSSHLLSYDTTFQLGDCYVSTMLFKNVLFRKSPVMPAIFMLHERKLRNNHDELMKIAAAQIPYFVKGKNIIPLVTDDEKGFTEAINDNLTNVRRFLCWNHVINSAKAWLRKHGALAKEIPVYVSHLRELFHKETQKDYEMQLEETKKIWSKAITMTKKCIKRLHRVIKIKDVLLII